MKKILVLTDSLGLPRCNNGESVSYEKTWINLLKSDFNIHQVSIGGATILDIVNQMDYHLLYYPDAVIVQAGIVDCAPRAFTKQERIFLSSIPIINKIFNKISAKFGKQIRNIRQKSFTTPREFKSAVIKLKNFYAPLPVYFLGIVPAVKEYEQKVKGIKKKIELYNSILKTNGNYISLEDFSIEHIMSDFHHLNENGNKYLSQKIITTLNNAIDVKS